MGLYDGRVGARGFASTAHVAGLTSSPVVLVVDISRASRSVGAVVHGMATFDDSVEIAGVILNKAGSTRHATEVAGSIDLPILGILGRDDTISAPSRHLGLVPAAERDEAAHALDALADRIAEDVDLEARAQAGRDGARPGRRAVGPGSGGGRGFDRLDRRWASSRRHGRRPRLHLPLHRDRGAAPRSRAAASRPSTRSSTGRSPRARRASTSAAASPRCTPPGSSDNAPLRADLRAAIEAGVPTVAECAGLLYLCRSVDDAEMVGVLPASAAMTPRLTLSYPSVLATADSLLTRAGEVGHRPRVPPHPRRPGGGPDPRLEHRRPAGRLRGPDPARVVPARALGRSPPARPAVRRRGPRMFGG